ncbi:BTB/POZ and MATH domain-containing protein 3 [Brachypodium distachyon]|uniref:MATH domain-containing protein n=1 Tax=Brachypodium distachyon TaxID=15368 RepID=I1IK53_BRADI|nr:BTB/POZ and MATH domain-containing protein 3 [Brachypodium distachyon]KQJ87666.1 hypothetical protein BRADI_4g12840v3 [Brachypodium distachyon]|eukprot:XP_010239063.3 BTB/POZ and MATH domain-containing protein 3 [Brachypodium distachyon]
MPMSAFMSALRSAGRQQLTASTVARRQATGSHLLRVEGFKEHVRDMAPNGKYITSSTFAVGGHQWQLKLYPNGLREKVKGSISLYLHHARRTPETGDAKAKFTFSLLDQAGKPWHIINVTQHHFQWSDSSPNWGFEDFLKIEDLDEEKHLKDDCLNVLVEVTVDHGLKSEDYIEVSPAL